MRIITEDHNCPECRTGCQCLYNFFGLISVINGFGRAIHIWIECALQTVLVR
jgi:hypothetical protein